MMCSVIQTVFETEKSHFMAWNPTSWPQNLRKQPKTRKMTTKMTEPIRGTCGGKWGPWGIGLGSRANEVGAIRILRKPSKHDFVAQKPSKIVENRRKTMFLAIYCRLLGAFKSTFNIWNDYFLVPYRFGTPKHHLYNDIHYIHHIAGILKKPRKSQIPKISHQIFRQKW